MGADIYTACVVSVLALGIIFLVLGILIGVIKTLVAVLPYSEVAAPPPKAQAPAKNQLQEEHTVAVIAGIAAHTGKSPHEIQIKNIASI
jgi:Na+-transporting methylmalonyl-CoA/oxaloacetate decarboxylase gamma subunit